MVSQYGTIFLCKIQTLYFTQYLLLVYICICVLYMSFSFFLFASQEKRKGPKEKRKTQSFSTSSLCSAVLFVRLRRISYARYCATHTLAFKAEHCLSAQHEFARLKKLGEVQKDKRPNRGKTSVRTQETMACFLFLFRSFSFSLLRK